MSLIEKTRSVPSRPMRFLPGAPLREQPDDSRHSEWRDDDGAPGARRRQRAEIVEVHADHRRRDEEEKEKENQKGDHRAVGELRMGSRQHQGSHTAAPILPKGPPANLPGLSDVRLDSGRLLAQVETHAFGTVEGRLSHLLAEGTEGPAAPGALPGQKLARLERPRP